MKTLAVRCWELHQASEAGDPWAEGILFHLAQRGPRAAQLAIDLAYGWHRHPGSPDPCEDAGCVEALAPAVWAASWEAYWPPGKHPGESPPPAAA